MPLFTAAHIFSFVNRVPASPRVYSSVMWTLWSMRTVSICTDLFVVRQTKVTELMFEPRASHMLAATILLDRRLALWTGLCTF